MNNPTPATETMNLRQTLGRALRSAVNLRVVTMVGDVRVSGSPEGSRIELPESGVAMVTSINLLEGDILTCISPQMATGDLADLQALHDGIVAKAEGIVDRNVRLVKDLIAAGFENVSS